MRFEFLDPNPAASKVRPRNRLVAREQQVVRQAQGGHSATAQPLLGHKMQTHLAPPPGVHARDIDVPHMNAAARGTIVFATERIEQLLLTIARHTCDAHHLAAADVQVNVLQVHAELVFARQA